MRCGQSLERLGLVEWANQYSYNRYKRYRITEKGIEYVENVLLRDNDKANAQIAACIHKNDGQLER
jgi:DNA-binding PadR family transcriptional regulator